MPETKIIDVGNESHSCRIAKTPLNGARTWDNKAWPVGFVGIAIGQQLVKNVIVYGASNDPTDDSNQHWHIALSNSSFPWMSKENPLIEIATNQTILATGFAIPESKQYLFPMVAYAIYVYRSTGYKVGNICEIKYEIGTCPANKFGYRCLHTCNCYEGEPCRDSDGYCENRKCAPNWIGLSCNIHEQTVSNTNMTTVEREELMSDMYIEPTTNEYENFYENGVPWPLSNKWNFFKSTPFLSSIIEKMYDCETRNGAMNKDMEKNDKTIISTTKIEKREWKPETNSSNGRANCQIIVVIIGCFIVNYKILMQ